MRPNIRTFGTVLAGLLMLLPLGITSPSVARSQNSPDMTVHPVWTMGNISRGTGDVGILVTDLTGDGVNELVSCSNGAPFVLGKQPSGDYRLVWYGEQMGCQHLASGDRDYNGIQELYITSVIPGTKDVQISILDGSTFAAIGSFVMPGEASIAGIAVLDMEGDEMTEIIAVSPNATNIYNARTLALEWHAAGFGGTALGIGDIEQDGRVELVVNGTPAHILDPGTHTEKWAYKAGFGTNMTTGDVDGDGIAEIIYATSDSHLVVMDAEEHMVKWDQVLDNPVVGLAVGDTHKTGIQEILVASDSGILGYEGTRGKNTWSIANSGDGASMGALTAGDPDGDNTNEVVWGSRSTSLYAGIFVANWATQQIEWWSGDTGMPMMVQAGDINADGHTELVAAWPSSTMKGGTKAGIAVYNPVTMQQEWTLAIPDPYLVMQVGVGQFQNDMGPGIVLLNSDEPRVRIYDGVTHALQWESGVLTYGTPVKMLVQDIDDDSLAEILVAQTGGITVLNPTVPSMERVIAPPTGMITDMALGNLDGKRGLELAVLTSQKLAVYNAFNWQLHSQMVLTNNSHVAIIPATAGAAGQVVTYGSIPTVGNKLSFWDGVDLHPIWSYMAEDWVRISDIQTVDVDNDGTTEVIMLGGTAAPIITPSDPPSPPPVWPSVLRIMNPASPGIWKYNNTGYWGTINGMVTGDFDQDGIRELFFGAYNLVQLNKIKLPAVPPTVPPVPTVTPIPFTDVTPDDYFYVPVQYLASHGVLSGYADGSFRPYNNTTRGQMAKIVVGGQGWAIDTTGGPHFKDVAPDSTFYAYIETAVNHGIVGGYSDGTYRPGDNVTRGQVAKIVVTAQGWATNTVAGVHFPDVGPNNVFYPYIETAYNHGVIGGFADGTYRPANPATRGQIAKIVYNAITR